MKLQFDISKKYSLMFLVGLFVLAGLVVVYAISPGVAPDPGHTVSQVAPPSGCQTGQFLQWTGSDWICVSGGSGGGPGGLVQKRIFVTSNTYNGNLGGLEGADSKCAKEAIDRFDWRDSGTGTGEWKAVLSTTTVSARSRIGYDWDELINAEGEVVARKGGCGGVPAGEAGAFSVYRSPWETGSVTSGTAWRNGTNLCNDILGSQSLSGVVWSGMGQRGDVARPVGILNFPQDTWRSTCNDWTSSSSNFNAVLGAEAFPSRTDSRWHSPGDLEPCNNQGHIICIEQ